MTLLQTKLPLGKFNCLEITLDYYYFFCIQRTLNMVSMLCIIFKYVQFPLYSVSFQRLRIGFNDEETEETKMTASTESHEKSVQQPNTRSLRMR